MENLKVNWDAVSKMTRIWWNLIRALESLQNLKYLMFDLKTTEELSFITLKGDVKFEEKTDLWFGKWLEEFGKFSPEHSQVSELELWWDPFIQGKKWMRLKLTEELCVMTMKNDTKIKEELNCRFKIDKKNFTNFDPSTQKSKKIVF